MPKISPQLLQTYFAGAVDYTQIRNTTDESVYALMHAGNRHPVYAETVLQYHPLKIHADGEFPMAMISERRPSESVDILEYRKKTYKAITKLPVSKVLNSLSKIRRSPDWMIQFKEGTSPARIIPEETLEHYLNHLPNYGNITDWIFGNLLKQNAIDANAVILVLPLNNPVINEYYKPVPIIFNSDHVLEFSEKKQIAILQSRIKVNINLEGGAINYNSGFRFYYVDDKEVIIYDQTATGYAPTFQIQHNLGRMPAFKLKGETYKHYDDLVVNKSRLDAMVPFLDEAACEYSDLKGSKIQHLFPLFWYYQNKDCNSCSGNGKKPTTNGEVACSDCDGSGKVKFSPFAHLQVNPPALGESGTPSPPAGYVTRDTAILELQDKSVDKNNFKALAAINMQFLDQTPLNISGDAKNVDREELNNFVYNFAEDLIASADKTIYWINEWRNAGIVEDEEDRLAMLPSIPVPQNFDLLPSGYLIDEITKARTQKVNPFLLAMLETQLAQKKFYNEPELAGTVKLFFDLDPLPGVGTDEKMTMLSNKGITIHDFVISCNLPQFIKKAIDNDPKFCDKKFEEQQKILSEYAEEKIKSNDEAATMIDAAKQKIIDEQMKNSSTDPAGE